MAKRILLSPKRKPELTWEVLSFDKTTGILQILDEHGQQFGADLATVKERCHRYVREVPDAE